MNRPPNIILRPIGFICSNERQVCGGNRH